MIPDLVKARHLQFFLCHPTKMAHENGQNRQLEKEL